MTSAVPHFRHTFKDYLFIEDRSDIKHEYLNGEIYVMSGGTLEHAAVCGALIGRLYQLGAGTPWRVYSPDLRIRVPATGLATYADATVARRLDAQSDRARR